MKSSGLIVSLVASWLAVSSPAFAVDTAKTYHSSVLVLAFLGFLALIVVVQLVPSILMLMGWIKSLAKGTTKEEAKRSQAG